MQLRITFFSYCSVWPSKTSRVSPSNSTCSSQYSKWKWQHEVSSCDLLQKQTSHEEMQPSKDCRFRLPRPRSQTPTLASACKSPGQWLYWSQKIKDRSVTPLSSMANFPLPPVELRLSQDPWKQRHLAIALSRDNTVEHFYINFIPNRTSSGTLTDPHNPHIQN